MGWDTPHDWVLLELVTARRFQEMQDELDYLKGSQSGQVEIELDAPVVVPHVIGSDDVDALTLRDQFISGIGTDFLLVSEDDTPARAITDGDKTDIYFRLQNNTGSTDELLGLLRFKRVSGDGEVSFWTASAGTLNSDPVLLLDGNSSKVAVNTGTVGSDDVEIDGDLNAEDGFVGLALWAEQPAGTALWEGDAEVTGTWKSTVATGTAPIQASSTFVVTNLNADSMAGKTWATGGLTDTGSPTIALSAHNYTGATVTATETSLYIVIGEASVTVAAGDVGALFTATITGGAGTARFRPRDSGRVYQLSVSGIYSATAAVDMVLILRKDSGSGSSTTTCSITAYRFGFAP